MKVCLCGYSFDISGLGDKNITHGVICSQQTVQYKTLKVFMHIHIEIAPTDCEFKNYKFLKML